MRLTHIVLRKRTTQGGERVHRKRIAVPLLAFVMITALGLTPNESRDLTDLKRAVAAESTAWRLGDIAAWPSLVDDNAIFTGADGETETKAQRVAKLQPRPRLASKPSDEWYRLYGDSAIRTWRFDGEVKDGPAAIGGFRSGSNNMAAGTGHLANYDDQIAMFSDQLAVYESRVTSSARVPSAPS
jgi:hypothetical protein